MLFPSAARVLEYSVGKSHNRYTGYKEGGCLYQYMLKKKKKVNGFAGTGKEDYLIFRFMLLQVYFTHEQYIYIFKAGQFHLNVDKKSLYAIPFIFIQKNMYI